MTYDGHNGRIDIDDDTLVITRQGAAAWMSVGKVPPRRVPLQAISGVRFGPSSPLVNGWIQLLLGGHDKPEPKATTAAGDPDVVLFTHGKREQFEQLHSWLQHVVSVNLASGMDFANVAFDPAQSRQDKLRTRNPPATGPRTQTGNANTAQIHPGILDELHRLAELRYTGAIAPDEFETRARQLTEYR